MSAGKGSGTKRGKYHCPASFEQKALLQAMVNEERSGINEDHAVARAIDRFLLIHPGFNRSTLK
jgi:hypothetical protein